MVWMILVIVSYTDFLLVSDGDGGDGHSWGLLMILALQAAGSRIFEQVTSTGRLAICGSWGEIWPWRREELHGDGDERSPEFH